MKIEDGLFTNNAALDYYPLSSWSTSGGGAIYLQEATLEVTGGSFTQNWADDAGGAIGTNNDYANTIKIKGGVFSHNMARNHEGGAICAGGKTELIIDADPNHLSNKIYFTNNKTLTEHDWGGGALFVSEGGTITSKYTLITGNTARSFGGGVGTCSTGEMYQSVQDGAAIFENDAKGEAPFRTPKPWDVELTEGNKVFEKYLSEYQCADDLFSANRSYIQDKMFVDADPNWIGVSADFPATPEEQEECKHRSEYDWMVKEGTKPLIISRSKQDEIKGIPVVQNKYTDGFIALKSRLKQTDIDIAKKNARVVMSGNYSGEHGGAIMSNGTLNLGEVKHSEDETPAKVTLNIYKRLKNSKGELLEGAQQANRFTFNCKCEDINETFEAKNAEDGSVKFDIEFTKPGEYPLYLSEKVENSDSAYEYDKSSKLIMVTVKYASGAKDGLVSVTENGEVSVHKRLVIESVKNYTGNSNEVLLDDPTTKKPIKNIASAHNVYVDAKDVNFTNTVIDPKEIHVKKDWGNSDKSLLPQNLKVFLMYDGKRLEGSEKTITSAEGWETFWKIPADQDLRHYSVGEECPQNFEQGKTEEKLSNANKRKDCTLKNTYKPSCEVSIYKTSFYSTELGQNYSKAFESARFSIKDSKGKVIEEDIKPTDKVNLKQGAYQLVETAAPNGYKIASPINFEVTEDVQVKDTSKYKVQFGAHGKRKNSTRDGSIIETVYSAKPSNEATLEDNLTNTTYTREKLTRDVAHDITVEKDHGRARRLLMSASFLGYPNNNLQIQQLNDLSSEEFYQVTQRVIWRLTMGKNAEEKLKKGLTNDQLEAYSTLLGKVNEMANLQNGHISSPIFMQDRIAYYASDKNAAYIGVRLEPHDSYYKNKDSLVMVDESRTTNVEVNKHWHDARGNELPKVNDKAEVSLFANDEKVATVELSSEQGNSFKFENLPVYLNGEKITYSVKEKNMEEWALGKVDRSKENNKTVFDLYNIKDSTRVSVSVKKVWDDRQNQDGMRPSSIKVVLLANGKPCEDRNGKPIILHNNYLAHTWGFLPSKDEEGKKIEYTVKEEADTNATVKGDLTKYNTNRPNNEPRILINKKGSGEDPSFTIINEHKPEIADFKVNKVWKDNNNEEGLRPNFVDVDLSADGKVIKTVKLRKYKKAKPGRVDWQYHFKNLPKYKHGKEIKYEIAEKEVPEGYNSEVNGFTITNTRKPFKIETHKEWHDDNNRDGLRPKEIPVKLMANGENVKNGEATLSKENDWKHTFDNLPEYKKGKKIKYEVVEELPENYKQVQKATAGSNFTLINEHKPKTINIAGRKIWRDCGNYDKIRPESVKIQLQKSTDGLVSDVEGKCLEVSGGTEAEWAYEFKDLPEYEQGKKIIYSVREAEPPQGYQVGIPADESKKFDVYNIHEPENVIELPASGSAKLRTIYIAGMCLIIAAVFGEAFYRRKFSSNRS